MIAIIGAYEFIKKIKFNLIIAVQLAVFTVMLSAVIGYSQYCKSVYTMLDNVKEQNMVFYMPDDLIPYENGRRDLVIDRSGSFDRESFRSCFAYDSEGNEYFVIAYGKHMARNFPAFLSKGTWLPEENKDGISRCVYFGKKKPPIDTVFELTFFDEKGMPVLFNAFSVCGIAADSIQWPTFVRSSNVLTGGDLFMEFTPDDFGTDTVIIQNDAVYEYAGEINGNLFLFPSEGTDGRTLSDSLKNEAWSCTYDELVDNTREEFRLTVSSYVPFLLCFLIMGSVGLLCHSLLYIYLNRHRDAVYRLCGMSRRDSFVINLTGNLLLAAIVLVLSSMIYTVLLLTGNLEIYHMRFSGILMGAAFITVLLVLLSMIPCSIKRGKNLVHELEEDEA